MWKYVDDTTITETVTKGETSLIQAAVDTLVNKTQADSFQLNEAKCKELRISFSKSKSNFDPIIVNGNNLEIVENANILGINISSNLKWKCSYFCDY